MKVYEFFSNVIKNQFPKAISIAPKSFKNDKELFSQLVERNGSSLKHASLDIRNNKEIILKAINQNYQSFQYASNQLKNDREFILQAISINGCILENASDALKCDREIVMQAVKRNGTSYRYACDELKNDREIAIEAMKSDAFHLIISKGQYQFVEMFEMNAELLYWDLSERFTNDVEFNKEAIEIYRDVLKDTTVSLVENE